jgi:hypothetical protein
LTISVAQSGHFFGMRSASCPSGAGRRARRSEG